MAAEVSATRLYLGNLPRDGMQVQIQIPRFFTWDAVLEPGRPNPPQTRQL